MSFRYGFKKGWALVMIFTLYPAILSAQWIRTHDLAGQIARSLVCDSHFMYVAVRYSVVMRSDDIFELRRVYPDIPNSALEELIRLNKEMYPIYFVK